MAQAGTGNGLILPIAASDGLTEQAYRRRRAANFYIILRHSVLLWQCQLKQNFAGTMKEKAIHRYGRSVAPAFTKIDVNILLYQNILTLTRFEMSVDKGGVVVIALPKTEEDHLLHYYGKTSCLNALDDSENGSDVAFPINR